MLVLARHVPGLDNGVADALTHKQMQRFCHLAPVQLPVKARNHGGKVHSEPASCPCICQQGIRS